MQNLKFKIQSLVAAIIVLLTVAPSAFAHVVVKPAEVGVGKFQTFTMGVPVEKDIPTTGLRLVLPEGLNYVSPNVKPGWTINVKKDGAGEEAKVTEISWTGGSIPAGFRDEFMFSAQVPAEAGPLNWKAYQTYSDGEVVSWDQDPNAPKPSMAPGGDDDGGMTPYSVTKVINDLKESSDSKQIMSDNKEQSNLPLLLSVVAVILSGFSLALALRKK